MTELPLFPLIVMGLLAAAGLFGLASARSARRREVSLAAHAGMIDPQRLAGLHDHLLRTAVELYGERELAQGRARIECAVALRDRLDALAGRPHGALNRSRVRARLLPGAHRLRGWPPPRRVREYLDEHCLAGDGPVASDMEPDARRMLEAASADSA